MTNITTPHSYRCDLNTGPCEAELRTPLMYQDALADEFRVAVYRGDDPVDLTGMTVHGSVYYAATRQTRGLVGSVDGHYASVTLDADCYKLPGLVCITIQLETAGGVRHTVLKVDGLVVRTRSEAYQSGPLIPALISREELIQAVVDAIRVESPEAHIIYGDISSDNTIALHGDLSTGTYTFAYINDDGTTSLIGTHTISSDNGDDDTGETFNVPITWIYNTKLSKSTGEVESASDGDYNASDFIDLVAGASYVIATKTDCYNSMNIVYYDDNKAFVGYQAECWASNSVDNPDDGNPQSCVLVIPDGATKIRLRQFETWNTQGESTKYVTLTGTMP